MLGLFLILPVFAIHARTLPGYDPALVGWVLGAYGLTQGLLQIPFGMASDRFGRKPVIVFGLLLFAAGSFLAAMPGDLLQAVIGRALQGAGAISAVVSALLADLTRDSQRSKAMAMIGASIVLTFALSLIGAPPLYAAIGMDGIFNLTGALALAAVGVALWVVPAPPPAVPMAARPRFLSVVLDGELLRLNLGIFSLHLVQMAIFVVIPVALTTSGQLPVGEHWMVYLPVVLVSLAFMMPPVLWGERRGQSRTVLLGAVLAMGAVQMGLVAGVRHFWVLVVLLLLFFVCFNILEAMLPTLVSRRAPPAAKGAALGVYNTTQSLGLASGGILGGILVKYTGTESVFLFGAAMMFLWFIAAFSMREPVMPGSATRVEGELKHGLSQ
ncbi:MAG: MFS transporter [Burkholderiales bacterium]|nr:MFS transporter [Burkholderiales bacterium]